jgi:hypothetical protein
LTDALIIGYDNGLYFSNFEPCIMPGENANAEGQQEDGDADRRASSQIRKETPTDNSFAFV